MPKHLFIGGSRHGQLHEVDCGCRSVQYLDEHYRAQIFQRINGRRITMFVLQAPILPALPGPEMVIDAFAAALVHEVVDLG